MLGWLGLVGFLFIFAVAIFISCALLVRVLRLLRRRFKSNHGVLRVTFLHPNLGIGGAERLVVDAAMALEERGHVVDFITGFHSAQHCFPETIGRLPVRVVNKIRSKKIPDNYKGKFRFFFVHLRMFVIAVYAGFKRTATDVFIVDQDATPCVFLTLCGMPTLFYCHFPDKLCDPTRTVAPGAPSAPTRTQLRKLYRMAFDLYEEFCMFFATTILFYSEFTKTTTLQAFPILRVALNLFKRKKSTQGGAGASGAGTAMSGDGQQDEEIVYPVFSVLDCDVRVDERDEYKGEVSPLVDGVVVGVTSVNRFERKKNVVLLVRAFAELVGKGRGMVDGKELHLFLAGGYNPDLEDNVEALREVREEIAKSNLESRAHILLSMSDAVKQNILRYARVVVYTPEAEHFGIVPIEAMALGTLVVAYGHGGPKETVAHQQTGYLVEAGHYNPKAFAEGIEWCLDNACVEKSAAARKRVNARYTRKALGQNLENHLLKIK